MLLSLRASSSRLATVRTFTSTARALDKAPLRASVETPTPVDLLNLIGRGAEKRLAAQGESWDTLNQLWFKGRPAIKDSGLSIRDRRYVLWALARYSQGDAPSTFIRPPKPPKKFRG